MQEKKTYTQANISRMVESTDVPMQDTVQKKHTNLKEKQNVKLRAERVYLLGAEIVLLLPHVLGSSFDRYHAYIRDWVRSDSYYKWLH